MKSNVTDRDITCTDCETKFVGHYNAKRCDECQTRRYSAEARAKDRESYYAHPEQSKRRLHKSYIKYKPKRDADNQKWAEENREASKAIKDKWIKNNPEKHKKAMERGMAKRRARKLGAILPDTDFKKIDVIFAKKNEMNEATGIPHEVDHIIALAIGGAHHQGNLRVITAFDNRKKGQKYDPSLGGVWADNDLARETKKKLRIK